MTWPLSLPGKSNLSDAEEIPEGLASSVREGSALKWICLVMILTLIGGLLRFYFVNRADFPLNDGGLFYVMIRDLQANYYLLPKFTSYNFANIPFDYSPLSFYLAGTTNESFNVSLLEILWFLPALLSTLGIPLFFVLAHELSSKPEQAVYATIAFVILLTAFEWLVKGGGLTRSLAYLFSLASLYHTLQAFKYKKYRPAVFAGLFLGLTALSHQEIFMVTITTTAIFFCFLDRNRHWVVTMGITWVIAGLIASHYILAAYGQHGIAPFNAALGSGEFDPVRIVIKFLTLNFTGEVYYTPFIVIPLTGIWGCIAERKYLLPVWLLVMTIINPRSVERTGIVQIAMFVGIGLDRVILPALTKLAVPAQKIGSFTNQENPELIYRRFGDRAGWIRAAFLVRLCLQAGFLVWLLNLQNPHLSNLPVPERSAMEWVANNTPQEGRFLVLSNSDGWAKDRVAEWFPALSQRASTNTVQGLEWAQVGGFTRMRIYYDDL
jgi:hypothetical protein